MNQNELESGIEGDYDDYYYDDYESTTTTTTTTTDSSGCDYPDWVGDEYCDDENNIADCSFDGGDCCGDNVDTSFCSQCLCLEECDYPDWVGDEYCDDESNIADCSFDGGDCCGDNVDTLFCSQCLCLEDQTSSALTTTVTTTKITTSTTTTATTEVLITTFGKHHNWSYLSFIAYFPFVNESLIFVDQNQTTTMNGTTDKKRPITPTKLKRINAATAKLGLSVLLHPDKENYQDAVLNNFAGFKVLVHSPYDFARVAAKGFTIDTKVEAFIASMKIDEFLY